jgi:predicted ribosomally synthesized peptide with SipW-like signal peptide
VIFAKNKKQYKTIALALSLCVIFLWTMLGTGISLAWFNDTSTDTKNIFHVANFDLAVSYKDKSGEWIPVDGSTSVFDDDAIYEPGYAQVVYLKVENKGDCDFQFQSAVSVDKYTEAINRLGQPFSLHEHLKFGAVFSESEQAAADEVKDRDDASRIATMKLSNYWDKSTTIEAGGVTYMAMVVYMPIEIGNESNYYGDVIPKIELGLVFNATQQA